jgi:hypothetical protein
VDDLAARLERVEARLDIQELACRYARAADARDVDALVALFTPDGRLGAADGETLKDRFDRVLRRFYRSIHQVVGHVIDHIDGDAAEGTVYCRAEHEDGDRWVVMAICYFDRYRRLDGCWRFEERLVRHWYSSDLLERPRGPSFQRWAGHEHHQPELPHAFATWVDFWSGPAGSGAVTSWP